MTDYNVLIHSEGSTVVLFPGWLIPRMDSSMDTIYNLFARDLTYQRPLIRQMMTGNMIPIPRLQFAAGNTGITNHNYSSVSLNMTDWTNANYPVDGLRIIRDIIAQDTNLMLLSNNSVPNSCLVNYYRNGNDSVELHPDRELRDDSQTVYTITLGQPRPFRLVHNITEQKVECVPQPGDLLIMTGNTQKDWKHGVPKRSANKYNSGRISLTYRVI